MLIVALATAGELYDSHSPVSVFNNMNFAKRVTNNRKKGISIVHFHKDSDLTSEKIKGELETFGKENEGMYNLGAVDCDDNANICEKEGIKDTPTFRIYPPHPVPTLDIDKDNYSLKKLKKKASRFIDDKVIEINLQNLVTFIKDNPGKSKVLLFTDKEKDIPVIYKALSYNFEKTLFFGIVRSSEKQLAKKYKVKNYPAIFLEKPGEQPRRFEGKMNYYEIANFINIYSEIFDFGDHAAAVAESAASKPWMSEKLPELTQASANDICFGKKGL